MKLPQIILVFLIIFSPAVFAERLIGKVVGISDGDTITILTPEKVSRKIRLAEIDAPEKKPAMGKQIETGAFRTDL